MVLHELATLSPLALACFDTTVLFVECNQPPAHSHKIGNDLSQCFLGVHHSTLAHTYIWLTGAFKKVPFFNYATLCGSVHCSFPMGGFKHQ